MARKRTIRVAVVGVGNMGWQHSRVFRSLPGVSLVGVADRDDRSARRAGRFFRCPAFSDYRQMLRSVGVDAISVAVPTNLHFAIGRDVLRAGRHLLVEKPMSRTLEEARRLITLAKRSRLTLAVGHVERFNPAIRKLKELYDQGALGQAITVVARRVGLYPPSFGGANVILDLAIHDLDTLHYILDESIARIAADAGRVHVNSRDDHAEILIEMRRATALIQVNWITPVKIRTFSLTGTKGYAEVDELRQELRLARPVGGRTFADFPEFLRRFGTARMIRVPVKRREPLAEELVDFVAAVRDRRRPQVTGEDGLWALKVAQAAIRVTRRSGI